jgi:hypothetical protein
LCEVDHITPKRFDHSMPAYEAAWQAPYNNRQEARQLVTLLLLTGRYGVVHQALARPPALAIIRKRAAS